jgi:CPA1 family monovalent cation:H+ antiporter
MLPPIGFVLALLAATIPLVALARRGGIPYPVVLVVGGLVLGFVPGLPPIQLNPDLVFVIFLPPLLYWESVTAPTDAMRSNAAWIWSLAVGLVIATTVAVALTVHALVPHMAWAIALMLGAIVAPTDETASAPTLERFHIPRRLVAIIEGESLLNDAGSLIIYAAAVSAVVTGTFSTRGILVHLVLAAGGAVAIGLAVGWLAVKAWRAFPESEIQQVISLILPFAAYVPAQRLEWSGVLAVVTAGIYVNRYTPIVVTPLARLQATGFWETMVFLANVVIFMLVGLQLHGILASLSRFSVWSLAIYALAVNVTVIVVRFLWTFGQGAVFRLLHPRRGSAQEQWRYQVIGAWSGLRGGVSLAAALAIPVAVAGGRPFPDRDLLIFLTFSVILVTLVGGAVTLPFVVSGLKIKEDGTDEAEERRALKAMATAARARIDAIEQEGRLEKSAAAMLRRHYDHELNRALGETDTAARLGDVEQEIVDIERATLIDLRNRGDIDNVVLRRLQLFLDMQEVQLKRTG